MLFKIADILINLELDNINVDDFAASPFLYNLNNDGEFNLLPKIEIKVESKKTLQKQVYESKTSFLGFDIYYDKEIEERILPGKNIILAKSIYKISTNKIKLQLLDNLYVQQWKASNILNLVALEKILMQFETIILHSSLIKVGDISILFSGKSGIGKTTQADLWVDQRNVEIINGDKAAIRKKDGKYYSYGLPVAGSSQIFKNIRTPLGAIILLNQGAEFSIKELEGMEAFIRLYPNVTINYWDSNYIDSVSNVLTELINEIPIIEFTCPLSEKSVNYLESYLIKKGIIYGKQG